jgi:hypothetical protein
VSRMTLKVWGGVPREISEKSRQRQQLFLNICQREQPAQRTLSVQEVGDRHRVCPVRNIRGLEDLLDV